jgi:hypothetical protein
VLTAFLLGLVVVAPIAIIMGVRRNRDLQRETRSATVELVVDEFGIRRAVANGREEAVDWVEVTEVEVYRTTDGPHRKAGGMILVSGDLTRGALVPLDLLGTEGLVEGLSRLPGFDVRLLTEAVQALPPCQLVVWRKGS